MLKLLRGDDSAAITLQINSSGGVNLSGCKLTFAVGSFAKTFDLGATNSLSWDIPADWTAAQPAGVQMASIVITTSDAKRVTVSNTIPIELTDVVQDASDSSAANISFSTSGLLSGLTFSRTGSNTDTINFIASITSRLGGSVSN